MLLHTNIKQGADIATLILSTLIEMIVILSL